MKIKNLSKDRSPKPFKFEDQGIVFMVKPADQNIRSLFLRQAINNSPDLLTTESRRYFGRYMIDDWSGLFDDETDEPVPFSHETAAELMAEESLDDLFYELFNFSYKLSEDSQKAQEKDAEDAAKK